MYFIGDSSFFYTVKDTVICINIKTARKDWIFETLVPLIVILFFFKLTDFHPDLPALWCCHLVTNVIYKLEFPIDCSPTSCPYLRICLKGKGGEQTINFNKEIRVHVYCSDLISVTRSGYLLQSGRVWNDEIGCFITYSLDSTWSRVVDLMFTVWLIFELARAPLFAHFPVTLFEAEM